MNRTTLSKALMDNWVKRSKLLEIDDKELNMIKSSYDDIAEDVFEIIGEDIERIPEISRDNEIKMNMANSMFCAILPGLESDNLTISAYVDAVNNCCNYAEQIFNRFNK